MTLIQRNRRAKVFFLGGVFLACMCPLMLQVMETRLLSVISWYYLAFFAISMAMFGMTAGSLFVCRFAGCVSTLGKARRCGSVGCQSGRGRRPDAGSAQSR